LQAALQRYGLSETNHRKIVIGGNAENVGFDRFTSAKSNEQHVLNNVIVGDDVSGASSQMDPLPL
jgi:hypothetical protein